TAMDVARAAVRLGSKEVQVACLESKKAMPALPWEIENTTREGAKIHPALAPQAFRNDGQGRVAGVDFKRVASHQIDKEGSLTWTLAEGKGSALSMDADSVIIAIGQVPTLESLSAEGKLALTSRKTLAVDPETLACGPPGLFAAGDAVVGAGTIVEGMAAGRKAAGSIIKYFTGSEPRKEEMSIEETFRRVRQSVNEDFPKERQRQIMHTL
ncbi:MAG: FAD-dependent oxidoreductase, partial [Deltaproteobacteria bacterium]|nr:FAD-dependent oxidoreductase [Deltaproteobacteria bacterium]